MKRDLSFVVPAGPRSAVEAGVHERDVEDLPMAFAR